MTAHELRNPGFALAACGSSVTKEQADQVCNNLTASQILGTDGVAFARKDLEKTFGLSLNPWTNGAGDRRVNEGSAL